MGGGKSPVKLKLDTETKGSTDSILRNPQAPGCSALSAAWVLLGFL